MHNHKEKHGWRHNGRTTMGNLVGRNEEHRRRWGSIYRLLFFMLMKKFGDHNIGFKFLPKVMLSAEWTLHFPSLNFVKGFTDKLRVSPTKT